MTDAVITALRAAADLIAQHGLARGPSGYNPATGACCGLIALGKATSSEAVFRAAKSALERWVRPPGASIPNWNDAPGRTADEVITALRRCAASLEGA